MRKTLATGAAAAAAMLATGAAFAVGPWPGLAEAVQSPSGDLSYSATRADGMTTVRVAKAGVVRRSAGLRGAWGIPAVTSAGTAGGLSPDGRLLVLVQPPHYNGLRSNSRFVVLSTRTLSPVASISLPGEFGFDALSPDDGILYLIQHSLQSDLVRYSVRAYDLRTRKLLPGVVADKRNLDEAMRGYAVARATSARGDWVYTLYTKNAGNSSTFVHALNAAGRSAFCIDLPPWSAAGNIWDARLELAGRTLRVLAGDGRTVARIDTRTLEVRR